MECTWKSKEQPKCTTQATHLRIGANRKPWANLCDVHQHKLEQVEGKNAPLMLGFWIAAQGGPKAATALTLADRPCEFDNHFHLYNHVTQQLECATCLGLI
jgi:hypothetical protein